MRELNEKVDLLVRNSGSPSKSITRPDDTTGYAANDVIGTATSGTLKFENVLPSDNAGAGFIISRAWLRVDVNAIPTGMSGFRLHLFNATPGDIADNAAFNLAAADRSKYLGYIDIDPPNDFGDTLYVETTNLNFQGRLAYDSTTLYGILQTLGAYTPTAQAVKTIGLETMGV